MTLHRHSPARTWWLRRRPCILAALTGALVTLVTIYLAFR